MQHRAPGLIELQDLDAADIGRLILPHVERDIAKHGGNRDPSFIARSLAEQSGDPAGAPRIAQLVMEGVQYLIRAGFLIPDVLSNGERYRLSRAGAQAAGSPHATSTAIPLSDAQALLHPRIARAALADYERGPGRYDHAVFSAFRELEIVVRECSGLDESAINLMNAALGAGKTSQRGALARDG
jgi:hypothetical protein